MGLYDYPRRLTIPRVKEARLSNSYSSIYTDGDTVHAAGAEIGLSIKGANGITTSATEGSPDALVVDGATLTNALAAHIVADDHNIYLLIDGTRAMTGSLELPSADGSSVKFGATTTNSLFLSDDYLHLYATKGVRIVQQADNSQSGRGLLEITALAPAEFIGTDVTQYGIKLEPEILQSGTSSFVGIYCNVTQSQAGTGQDYLMDLQWGARSKLSVSDTGALTAAGLITANGSLVIADNSILGFGGTSNSYFRPRSDIDQLHLSLNAAEGSQLVVAGWLNLDYGHGAQTDPTIFIHSVTSPATDDTEWLSLTHNQTRGVIASGKGGLQLKPFNGALLIQRAAEDWGGQLYASAADQLTVRNMAGNADGDLLCKGLTASAKSTIDGSADEVQLVVQANAAQANTNPLIQLQKSDGTVLTSLHSDNAANLFMGVDAGGKNAVSGSDGINNFFMGPSAGKENTSGKENVAIGNSALKFNQTGDFNVCIGYLAGAGASTKSYSHNTYIGRIAGWACSTGGSNFALGSESGRYNTTGNYNISIGRRALYRNPSGSSNVCIGHGSGSGATGQAHSHNSFIGFNAGGKITTGLNNVAIGSGAGFELTTGANNLLLGYKTGDNLTTGANNIVIGYDLNASAVGVSNELNIGGLYRGDTSTGVTKISKADDTNYASFAADGELSLHGTARVKRHLHVAPPDFQKPVANFPDDSFVGLFATLDFDKTVEQSAYYTFNVPNRWAVDSDVNLHLIWCHDTNQATQLIFCRWGAEWSIVGATEPFATAATSTITKDVSTLDRNEDDYIYTEFDSPISGIELAAHDQVGLRIYRDVADDMDEDARLVGLHIEFLVDKLGEAT